MKTDRRIKKGEGHTQRGFTLLEMLLTISVLASILLVITQLLEETARSEFYAANATYMNSVMDIAVDAVDAIDKFNTIHAMAQTLNSVEIPVEIIPPSGTAGFTFATGALTAFGDVPPHPDLSNTGFKETGPLKTGVTILYQALDDPANPNDERRLAVIVATLSPVQEKSLRQAAQAIGAGGGYISVIAPTEAGICLPVGCGETIRSAYGAWSMDATTFAGTRWRNNFDANPPSGTAGGYLFSFRFINESEVTGDYLYRTPQPARPELNRMNAQIDMAGNNVVGIDNVNISGDFNVDSDIYVQGSVFAYGNFEGLGSDITVDGDMETGNLSLGLSYDPADPRLNGSSTNTVSIENILTTGSAAVNQNLSAPNADFGQTLATTMRALDMMTNSLDANTATPSAGIFATSTTTNDLAIQQNMNSGEIVSNTQTSATGNVGTLNMTISNGSLNFSGTMDAQVSDFSNVNINQLEQCLSGC